MIPLIPGRLHQKRGAGDSIMFRRKEGDSLKTHGLPNRLIYIGPHPDHPHLALFKSDQNPSWFYWDVPENFIPIEEAATVDHNRGFRATRPSNALWGRID